MKIGTYNIDWAKKYSSESHFKKIENVLNQKDFDFLILTEAIDLNLKNFAFKYFSVPIPENQIYEHVNYTSYLNGEKAFRTAIYSKVSCKRQFKVKDNKTSLALEFATKFGDVVIYATIIGTLFRRKPFAKIELQNCINDCEEIYKSNSNLIIVGDLNTSFLDNEKVYSINSETTGVLRKLFGRLNLFNTTENSTENIDHIIIPMHFKVNLIKSEVFVVANMLSDHKGVSITLDL